MLLTGVRRRRIVETSLEIVTIHWRLAHVKRNVRARVCIYKDEKKRGIVVSL